VKGCLWVFVFLSSICCQSRAFDELDWLPDDTIAFVQINDTDACFNELKTLIEALATNHELVKLVNEKPYPLIESGDDQRLDELFHSTYSTIQRFNSLTLYVKTIDPKPLYCISIRFDPKDEAAIRGWINTITGAFGDQKSESDGHAAQSKTEDAEGGYQVIENQFSAICSICCEFLDGQLLIANSAPLLTEITERFHEIARGKTLPDLLKNNPRFKRTIKLTGVNSNHTGYAYFVPIKFTKVFYPELDADAIRKYGFEELIGVGVTLEIAAENLGEGSTPRLILETHIPFTSPLSGKALTWSKFKPIGKIPRINFRMTNVPKRLMIGNRDNEEYFQETKNLYDNVHGAGAFLKMQNRAWQHVGGYDVVRRRDNGITCQYWYEHNNIGRYFLFYGIDTKDGAEAYVDKLHQFQNKEYPDFAYEKTDIDGYPGWFFPVPTQIKKFESDFGKKFDESKRSHLDSAGQLVGNNWTIYGDRNEIEDYLFSTGDALESIRNLNLLFPGIDKFLKSESAPSWLYLYWAKSRKNSLDNLVYDYLKSRYDRREASKILRQLMVGEIAHVPIKTKSDKIVAVAELVINEVLNLYGREATAFYFHGPRHGKNRDFVARQPGTG